MDRKQKQLGFTLAELTVALALTAILLAALLSLLSTSLNSWQAGSTRTELQQTARYAVDMMVRELQYANSIIINSETSLTLQTNQYQSKTVTYFLDSNSNPPILRRNQHDNSGSLPVTGDGSLPNVGVTVEFKPLKYVNGNDAIVKTVGITLKAWDDTQKDAAKQQAYKIQTAVTGINVK